MNNIFSSIPVSTLQSIINTKDTLDFVEQYLFRFTPLEFGNILNEKKYLYPIRTLNEFRENAKNVAFQGKLDDIIHNTIEVCSPYLTPFNRYDKSTSNVKFVYDICFNQGTLALPYINDFQATMFNDEYTEELKTFLGLMYFYVVSHKNKSSEKCIDKKELSSAMNNGEMPDGKSKGYMKVKGDNFRRNGKLFTNTFLSYGNRTQSNQDSCPIRTPLDIEFNVALIYTSQSNKNPFCDHASTNNDDRPIKYDDVKLKTFLNICERNMSWEGASFSKVMEIINLRFSDYSAQTIYTYNQYLVERLAGINFANMLVKHYENWQEESLVSHQLENFLLSPLLNFRRKVIEFHNKIDKNTRIQTDFVNEWVEYLQTILFHQLSCALPILTLTFFYFMALRSHQESKVQDDITEQMNKYCNLKSVRTYVKWFDFNNKILIPVKDYFTSNNKSGLISGRIYKNFFANAYNYMWNNILSPQVIDRLCKQHSFLIQEYLMNDMKSFFTPIITANNGDNPNTITNQG